MTQALSGEQLATRLNQQFPDSIAGFDDNSALVNPDLSGSLLGLAAFLKTAPDLEFDFLSTITAVDYFDYFEVVYQLTSLKHNHSTVLKTRCYDRDNPVLPSLVRLWRGAELQEQEIFDLMGIRFEGHPNMKRIVLWEGFQGHPLRKDFLSW
ncbi:MAG: NADH-quinone oxidoreductase subunit C [Chloroflexi bacterium]|nr:NADH-quinone oxidoreductase subunit C [Chloroflexota bacterium]